MRGVDVTGAFAGARVVVTGAGGIFGRRLAAAFSRAGARLGLSDHRPEVVERLPGELGLARDTTVLHVTELREEGSILCSDRAAYITGATLAVDGGSSIGTVDPTVGPAPGPPA